MVWLLKKYVEVVPLRRLKRDLGVFDYKLPPQLQERITVGQLVSIPFRQTNITGIVVKIKNQPANLSFRCKAVNNIINQASLLNPQQIQLALQLAQEYYVSPALFFKLMLPEIKQRIKDRQPILTNRRKLKPTLIIYRHSPTKIIQQLIAKTIKTNKQVLILEPQLADIESIKQELTVTSNQAITIVHGTLTAKQKLAAWQKIYSGEAKVILGTKAALFYNYFNLGLTIIDQEQSADYKNYDQNPRYHAREVALELANLSSAKLILASFAPSVETYFLAQENHWQLLTETAPPMDCQIIDLQDERLKQNFSPLSEELQRQIKQALQRKEQVLLFLNRRGQGTFLACQDCGYQVNCPNCQLSLVEHQHGTKLVCHRCGYERPSLLACPQCHRAGLTSRGLGTQKLEQEVNKLWPPARILRLDKDQPLLNPELLNQADIIIATQTIFHLPNSLSGEGIKLVAIINFNQLLQAPTFNAAEQAWQILWRCRSYFHRQAPKFIIQTHTPQNTMLTAFVNNHFKQYYIKELQERIKYQLPPSVKLIKLFKKTKEENLLQEEVKIIIDRYKIYQPSGQEIKKSGNYYSAVIYLKVEPKKQLDFNSLPADWQVEINPEK